MGPDVMVAIGRPKGRRGSYKQWLEGDIVPQVVFEILSPSNKTKRGKQELQEKFKFYEVHKVQEYYIYDPDDLVLMGWHRSMGKFIAIAMQSEWISPLLKIRFGWQHGEELILYRPDGQRFLSSVELEQRAMVAERMAGIAQKRSEQEAIRASMAEEKAEQESIRANRLAALLKAMGVDPDQ
jgi:Uma2 family endonuclease